MKQPTTPLHCPICGRLPKLFMWRVECNRLYDKKEHYLCISSDTNMRPVAQWNAYVRRIRNRISKENAK